MEIFDIYKDMRYFKGCQSFLVRDIFHHETLKTRIFVNNKRTRNEVEFVFADVKLFRDLPPVMIPIGMAPRDDLFVNYAGVVTRKSGVLYHYNTYIPIFETDWSKVYDYFIKTWD